MIENRELVYIGDFRRLSSTGRASKDVLNAASTPFEGIKIRYRELKRAFMDNHS